MEEDFLMLENTIFKRIDTLKEYYVKVLTDMVSIPTVVPPGDHYKEFIDYARGVLKEIGLDTSVVEVSRNCLEKYIPEMKDYPRYIIIGRWGKGKGPVLHFNGHYDVVPPGTGWKTDPFKPTIINGKLYGRGASDMKGGIVSMLTAIKAIIDSEVEINGTIEISMTPDEEIGGMCGAKYMLEEKITEPDYCIIAEPSGYDRVWIGHKGVVWGEVAVYGKTAHASTPWLGINAFEKMVGLAKKMISTLKQDAEEINLGLPAEMAMNLSKKIAHIWKETMDKGQEKVALLCDSRLRSPLATILSRTVPPLQVIAYDEIVLGTEIEPIEAVSIQQTGLTEHKEQELVGNSI